jgi:PAS domain S-box-containing protein
VLGCTYRKSVVRMQRREFITFLGAAAAVWKRAKRPTALLREAAYLLLGFVSLATVTGLYFWLDVPLVAPAFTYLVVLVLLSLVSTLASLIVLSFIGVCCLSYFFAPPIYSFRVDYAQDLITISAFVIISFVVNFLVTRVRDTNQRLEVTNEALRIENLERKRAEQAQLESEDMLRQIIKTGSNLAWSAGSEGKKAEVRPGLMAQMQAILNLLPAYTWYAAPRGALTFVNTRTAEYLGIPNDHPLRFGMDVGAEWDHSFELLHPDDREDARKYWSSRLRTGEGGEHSYRVRSAQGDYRWFLTRMEPLRASDGTLLLWIGATLDIEELMRAEAEARENERRYREAQRELAHANRVATMGQLTASIAHEIKQPIGAARNNARAALNFLDKSPPDLAEVMEALTCIVSDADRASDVVDRIGSLIKKAPLRKEVVNLNAAILEVIALTRGEAVKTGVAVGTQLAGELPRIQCDRVQLQQVMLNLIINAIQSMSGVEDGNRELHISTASIEPEGVCVGVRDTGHGLRPESLPRLFEPFYTTKPDGMGMGLSICRSIIEAHGGRLWAIGCEPRGALFRFTIPVTGADGS